MTGYDERLMECWNEDIKLMINKSILIIKQIQVIRETVSYEEFISMATVVIWEIYRNFEPEMEGDAYTQFMTYLHKAFHYKFFTEVYANCAIVRNHYKHNKNKEKNPEEEHKEPKYKYMEEPKELINDEKIYNIEEIAERRMEAKRVHEAVNQLPDMQRKVIVGIYFRDYEVDELSNILNIREDACRQNKSRGLASLREILGQDKKVS